VGRCATGACIKMLAGGLLALCFFMVGLGGQGLAAGVWAECSSLSGVVR